VILHSCLCDKDRLRLKLGSKQEEERGKEAVQQFVTSPLSRYAALSGQALS
tara:strand:- start:199970 stop:200122 length:153 start_codon:yes stop_codon:yes gene_type:complete